MAITALGLTLGRQFFSRYEPARATVHASITQTGGTTGEVITTVLKRQTMGEPLTIATVETTLGATPASVIPMTFPLATIKDAHGFSPVRVSRFLHDYTVNVTAGAVEAEAMFTVTPVTPESIKSSYLKGIPLVNVNSIELEDGDIMEEVLRQYAYVTMLMHGELEPATVVTEKVLAAPSPPASYDLIGEPVGFYRQENRAQWLATHIPYHNVRKIHVLSGWFNQNKAVDITADWHVTIKQNGLVQMVPSSGASVIWQGVGIWGPSFLMATQSVPNFWHYHVTVGLRDIPLEILSFVGKRTAMSLLTTLGATVYAPGIVSSSLSRDGVTETRGLNPKGVYAALIDSLERSTGLDKDGKETLIAKLREKYIGFTMVTL